MTPDDVEAAYARLDYRRGWTFMATPEARMTTSPVAIVGLNPGGGGDRDLHPYGAVWDVPVSPEHPNGNAYFDETWGPNTDSSVQRQVKLWHERLGVQPGETFCAQFVPFRSPDWDRLGNRAEAMAFGRALWRWVLSRTPASLFVTMGKVAGAELAALIGAGCVGRLPVNWQPQTIDIWEAPDGRRIVAMPHPSRYGLLGRSTRGELAERNFHIAVGRG